jgi:hypothetical protein
MLSIDLDLPIFSVKVRDKAMWTILDVLERKKVAGASTWFINDNDFALTRDHQPFLRELLARGEAVGPHEHLDYLDGDWREPVIRPFMEQSFRTIRTWLDEQGHMKPMRVHRFGCLFQHPIAYRIAGELGFTIHSDVTPGVRHNNHLGNPSFDNTAVPVGVAPYRHGPDNINDHAGGAGPFLQVPVLQATLTANWWAKLDESTIQRWMEGAAELGVDRPAVSFCYHPFELVTGQRVNPESVERLAWVIDMLRESFGARLVNMEQYAGEVGVR